MASQRNQGTVASGSSTVQQVVDFIERKIRSQEFRSGDRVPTESELCALLWRQPHLCPRGHQDFGIHDLSPGAAWRRHLYLQSQGHHLLHRMEV